MTTTAGGPGAGRLADFEDADLAAPQITLPPRRPAPRPRDSAAPAPEPEPRPGHAAGTGRPARDREEPGAAATAPGPKGPQDRTRASVAAIPVDLLDPLTRRCAALQLTHGELIITAIEHAHPRLRDLAAPQFAGGGLFGTRPTTAHRAAGEQAPPTTLSFRLRVADFEVLDRLVEEVGAASRTHLITLALQDYLST